MIENVYDDEVPNVVEIKETIIETPTVKTFIFPWNITDNLLWYGIYIMKNQ